LKKWHLCVIAISCLVGGYGLYRDWKIQSIVREVGPVISVDHNELLSQSELVHGSNATRWMIVEFIDYECQPCKESHKSLLSSKVIKNLEIRVCHNPLTNIHPAAFRAASIVASIGSEELRSRVHDRLMMEKVSNDQLNELYQEICKDECIDIGVGEKKVKSNLSFGKAIGIAHTPTILLIAYGKVYEIQDLGKVLYKLEGGAL
jgi:protein-disulfide isomerase